MISSLKFIPGPIIGFSGNDISFPDSHFFQAPIRAFSKLEKWFAHCIRWPFALWTSSFAFLINLRIRPFYKLLSHIGVDSHLASLFATWLPEKRLQKEIRRVWVIFSIILVILRLFFAFLAKFWPLYSINRHLSIIIDKWNIFIDKNLSIIIDNYRYR